MYDVRPNTIVGFHGCELSIRNKLISNPNIIEISKKPYDWLGNGFYFWENNYTRAFQWANDKYNRGEIIIPAVLGAVLQLGNCCDFLDSKFTGLIESYYPAMAEEYQQAGKPLPKNLEARDDGNKDKLLRLLDCATIEYMHKSITENYFSDINNKNHSQFKVFDSVRGVFSEGGPAFPGAGIKKKSHIQICIRNLNCIKGFFIPREEIDFPLPL
jgi:hypothetical protein